MSMDLNIPVQLYPSLHVKPGLSKVFWYCSSSQPANRLTAWPYAHSSHLTRPPPTHGVPGQSTSIPVTWTVKPASLTIHLSCIYSHLSPNKASILWTAVRYCTCTVLFSTVESEPLLPQAHLIYEEDANLHTDKHAVLHTKNPNCVPTYCAVCTVCL